MHAFTMYIAAWLPDILVESSTGTRPSNTLRNMISDADPSSHNWFNDVLIYSI